MCDGCKEVHQDLFLVASMIIQEAPESQNTLKCAFIWYISKTEIKPKSLSNFSYAASQLRVFAGSQLQTVIGEIF